VLLQKKPEYGPATLELINTQLINSKTIMLIEKGSRVLINGEAIEGTELNVGDMFY